MTTADVLEGFVDLYFDKPLPEVADWSKVNEVRVYDGLLTPKMQAFLNEALIVHKKKITGMNEEAKLACDRLFT